MKPVSWRLRVVILAVVVLLPLLLKSRFTPPGEQAAFLHYTTGSVLVKIVGTGKQDGIYRFPDGALRSDVKKMAVVDAALNPVVYGGEYRRLRNGDVVDFSRSGSNSGAFAPKRMTVAEIMMLGIPLDPDAMSGEDWESLPGIGPVLAATIVNDRQKNGDFGSLDGVLRVPGIGIGKIQALRIFF